MAFSSSASINDIASQYQKNVGSGSELQWSQAGLVADLESAQLNNAWSAQQAQIQRDYETQMSNTAHQREVADLQAAGLNPVLSAHTNGATTPNGAVAVTDTGATGSGSKTATNALNAIVAQNNALVQANAAISSAAISASAMRYSADRALEAAIYGADRNQENNKYTVDNPNTLGGIIRTFLTGATGSNTAKDVGSKIGGVSKEVFKAGTGVRNLTYSSSNIYTQKSNSNSYISKSDLSSFNRKFNSNIKFYKNNFIYSDFNSYNQYLDFCKYFSLRPIHAVDFSKYNKSSVPHYLFKK